MLLLLLNRQLQQLQGLFIVSCFRVIIVILALLGLEFLFTQGCVKFDCQSKLLFENFSEIGIFGYILKNLHVEFKSLDQHVFRQVLIYVPNPHLIFIHWLTLRIFNRLQRNQTVSIASTRCVRHLFSHDAQFANQSNLQFLAWSSSNFFDIQKIRIQNIGQAQMSNVCIKTSTVKWNCLRFVVQFVFLRVKIFEIQIQIDNSGSKAQREEGMYGFLKLMTAFRVCVLFSQFYIFYTIL
eukprot:TRINITY_DN658_c0_g1_i7.p1 TRINITY_DN658_c0_g1~~TRINITY_DN658_c0_g1_i7.p1  ORF type:complete len:238 (-),score=-1.52 TRINITY_DN658_c0_g1_i7:362-1075(-)